MVIKYVLYDFVSIKFVEIFFSGTGCGISWWMIHGLSKKCILLLLGGMFCDEDLVVWLCSSGLLYPYWFFGLIFPLVAERELLRSSTVVMDLIISLFSSFCFCFMCFETFVRYVEDYYVFLGVDLFILFCLLVTFFVLKSTL